MVVELNLTHRMVPLVVHLPLYNPVYINICPLLSLSMSFKSFMGMSSGVLTLSDSESLVLLWPCGSTEQMGETLFLSSFTQSIRRPVVEIGQSLLLQVCPQNGSSNDPLSCS